MPYGAVAPASNTEVGKLDIRVPSISVLYILSVAASVIQRVLSEANEMPPWPVALTSNTVVGKELSHVPVASLPSHEWVM